MFTTEEAHEISDKLNAARELIDDALLLAREKDEDGLGDVCVHIDSDYNNIGDTLDILWNNVDEEQR